MSRIIHWNRGLNPQYDGFASRWLHEVDVARYVQSLSHDGLLDRVASVSYIAAMDERERAGVLAQVSELVRGFTEPIPLPYVTEVHTLTGAT